MASKEGFLLIDHRESPGFDESVIQRSLPFVPANKLFQAATNTCMHCDAVVIRNPNRTRPRGHCRSCDYFICDPCDAKYYLTGECLCREKRFELVCKGEL